MGVVGVVDRGGGNRSEDLGFVKVEDNSKWSSKFSELVEEEGEVQWGETSIGVIKVGGSDRLGAKAIIPRVVLGDPSCGALLKKVKQLGEKDGKAEGREEWAKGASLCKAFLLVKVI